MPIPNDATAYWLVHPTNTNLTVKLEIVTSDSYQEEDDHQVVNLLGRGRKINYGESFGITGTLECQLRDSVEFGTARAQKLALEALHAEKVAVELQNPFGDSYQVWIGPLSFQRVSGVGANEYMDVSIPYVEVIA